MNNRTIEEKKNKLCVCENVSDKIMCVCESVSDKIMCVCVEV